MSRFILLFASVVAMTALTITANWVAFDGQTTLESLNRLPVLFAPANYVYLLGILVFASLFIWLFSYYKIRKQEYFITPMQTGLFVAIAILQIVFFITWHYEVYIVSAITLLVQLLVMYGLYLTYPMTKKGSKMRLPFALFFSYTLFYFFVITSYLLVYFTWSGFGLSNGLWAVIMMTIATASSLHLRYHHDDIVSPIVFIWGFIGIIVKNGIDELFVSTAALFLCGVLVTGMIFMKKNRSAK